MVLEKVTAILADKLDCDASEIAADSKFTDMGIDSLDITELLMNVEDEFGISLEMDASMEQVSDLVAKIEEKLAEKN
jgi:acyl carrier protein